MQDNIYQKDEINKIENFGKINGYPIVRDESAVYLVNLVKMLNPNNILEIGTAIGYSGLLFLSNCEGYLTTLELREDSAEIAKENFEKLGFQNRYKIIVGDANLSIDDLSDNDYDFIFLDGPKAQYEKYYDRLIFKLKKGGIMVADNVLFRGMVKGEEEIPKRYRSIVKHLRNFINIVEQDVRVESQLKTIGDGLMIIKKR